MVYENFAFNPVRDKETVSVSGFVDLKSAYVNRTIPADMASSIDEYNGIEDPESILGKPRDVFEALDMSAKVSNPVSSNLNDEKSDFD